MILAKASTEDVETICAIETEAFTRPWSRRAIVEELLFPEGLPYVAKRKQSPQASASAIGYLFVRFLTDEMHIMKIAVAAKWRKLGMATSLLAAAQEEAKRRGVASTILEVRASNLGAIQFYQQFGFQTIGIRTNYYPPTGENALVMSKSLKEES